MSSIFLVMNKRSKSVHSAGIEQIYEMPLNEIIRPIPPQVDEAKVKSLMDALSVSVLKYDKNHMIINRYQILTNNNVEKNK